MLGFGLRCKETVKAFELVDDLCALQVTVAVLLQHGLKSQSPLDLSVELLLPHRITIPVASDRLELTVLHQEGREEIARMVHQPHLGAGLHPDLGAAMVHSVAAPVHEVRVLAK